MSWSLQKKKERILLYRLFFPKETFLTFMFYLNVQCVEYTFRIFILLHIHTFIRKYNCIHFFCLLLKSSKTFSVSLSKAFKKIMQMLLIQPNLFQVFELSGIMI